MKMNSLEEAEDLYECLLFCIGMKIRRTQNIQAGLCTVRYIVWPAGADIHYESE
jgi:hypothetical protein